MLSIITAEYSIERKIGDVLQLGLPAAAILSKSVLGIFPLAIVFTYLLFNRQWKEMVNPFLILGSLIALGLGFSWHLINWLEFGQHFIDVHFGILIFNRGFGDTNVSLNFLGYSEDFLRNYWPWLPFALVGMNKFYKQKRKEVYSFLILIYENRKIEIKSLAKNLANKNKVAIVNPNKFMRTIPK